MSWWRLLALLMVLVALIGLPIWWWSTRHQEPNSLTDTALVGERGPGCGRIVIASDESGSMQQFRHARDLALAQLLNWAPGNLRGDDELAVLAFSGDTFVAMPPTPVANQPVLGGTPGPTDGTKYSALLSALAALPASRCSTGLILLSDGKFHDLPTSAADNRNKLRDIGIDKLFLLVPGKDIEIDPGWDGVFPYAPPVVFDGTNPDKTGLAFGHTLADITGQQLATR